MTLDRQAQVTRILREIQAARARQAAMLARDYVPVARRLREAYAAVLPDIERMINQVVAGSVTALDADDLRRLQQQIARELAVLENELLDMAPRLQINGARAGLEVGARNLNSAGVGARFNALMIDDVIAAIDYVDNPVFRLRVGQLGSYHGEQIANLITAAVAQGRNPRETAAFIQQYMTGRARPLQDALRLARTTQVYSMRQGTRHIYERNEVDEWMWSANLGSERTCLACIAMHGTIHPVTEVLNDHHNGRCAMVPITPTWRELGFSDGVDPNYETGVDWFNRQDSDTQRQAMGPELYEAWQDGRFVFGPDSVVGEYENDIFGAMRRRLPNREILNN